MSSLPARRPNGNHPRAAGVPVRSILGCLASLLAVLAAPAPAHGSCVDPRAFGSLLGSRFSYVYTPGYAKPGEPSTSPRLDGSFWMLGFGDPEVGSGVDNGGFPAAEWTGAYSDPDWTYPTYIGPAGGNGWDADPRIDGCADDAPAPRCMGILLGDADAGGTGY